MNEAKLSCKKTLAFPILLDVSIFIYLYQYHYPFFLILFVDI